MDETETNILLRMFIRVSSWPSSRSIEPIYEPFIAESRVFQQNTTPLHSNSECLCFTSNYT